MVANNDDYRKIPGNRNRGFPGNEFKVEKVLLVADKSVAQQGVGLDNAYF
jgi:hypothetical protein